jgi:clan AA aspartic protease
MGTVYAEITLTNAGDKISAQRALITGPEVRRCTVRAVVDTGASTLFITEAVRQQLGLVGKEKRPARTASGARIICEVCEPVEIRWKERSTTCPAIVMPGAENILLGAIPLEDMDLIVNPARQVLEGAHGDEVVALAL